MSLLTPAQTVQLIKNGHKPDVDHVPPAYLMVLHEGVPVMQFMLTHVDPDYPDQAYGLIDFGHGKPRMSMVFLPQLESINEHDELHIEQDPYFKPTRPISVYHIASQIKGYITIFEPLLQMAETRITYQRFMDEKNNLTQPLRNQDNSGPAFLPFNLN